MGNLRRGSKYDGAEDITFGIYQKIGRKEVLLTDVERDGDTLYSINTAILNLKNRSNVGEDVRINSKKLLIDIANTEGLSGRLVFRTFIREGSETFIDKILLVVE